MSGREDFWSRRRAAVQAEEAAQQAAIEAEAQAQQQAELAEIPEAELLAELGLPDPDTLKDGDDFTAFMAKAVPEGIRRRALRTLWRSNPVLANVDMLVDYGEDFTDSATVIENLQTTYQVGKGMLKHVEEMARQDALEAESEVQPEEADEEAEEIYAVDGPEDVLSAEQPLALSEGLSDHGADEIGDEDEQLAMSAPRRMTFRVEETA